MSPKPVLDFGTVERERARVDVAEAEAPGPRVPLGPALARRLGRRAVDLAVEDAELALLDVEARERRELRLGGKENMQHDERRRFVQRSAFDVTERV